MAEDAWKCPNPDIVAPSYSGGSLWRNRDEFLSGREAIGTSGGDKGPRSWPTG